MVFFVLIVLYLLPNFSLTIMKQSLLDILSLASANEDMIRYIDFPGSKSNCNPVNRSIV